MKIFVEVVGSLQKTGIAFRSSRMFYPDQALVESVSFHHQQRPDAAAIKDLLAAMKDLRILLSNKKVII